MHRKALLEAEQRMLPASSSSIIQEDKAELKTGGDSGMVPLPGETNEDGLQMGMQTGDDLEGAKMESAKKEDLVIFPVTFIGARNPNDLFFRTPELADMFIKIQQALYACFCDQQFESAIQGSISCDIGYVCAVQSDGRWYRAKIVENVNHPDVVLSLLDKDLFVMVHVDEIRCLPMELTDIPRTVLRCSLYGISPAPGSSGWNPKVTQQ